jgi:hypothetical protein
VKPLDSARETIAVVAGGDGKARGVQSVLGVGARLVVVGSCVKACKESFELRRTFERQVPALSLKQEADGAGARTSEDLADKRANGAVEHHGGGSAGGGDLEARGHERFGRRGIDSLCGEITEADACAGRVRDSELDAEPPATCKALNCIPCHLFDREHGPNAQPPGFISCCAQTDELLWRRDVSDGGICCFLRFVEEAERIVVNLCPITNVCDAPTGHTRLVAYAHARVKGFGARKDLPHAEGLSARGDRVENLLGTILAEEELQQVISLA